MKLPYKKEIRDSIVGRLSGAEDNLFRARLATRNHPLDARYYESDRTLGEIIDEYEQELAKWHLILANYDAATRQEELTIPSTSD